MARQLPSARERTHVLLASANGAARTRWRQALQSSCVIHEEADGSALVGAMASLRPEVLLLDRSLPKLRRAGDIAGIQQASPRTAVLLLAAAPDKKEAIAALKAAVRGYCSIEITPRLLTRAIERIQNGEIWAGREVLSDLVSELVLLLARQKIPARAGSLRALTPREREIASFVKDGAINKEIGTRLNISEGTVKARLAAIFRKVGCANRVQLALIVENESSGPRAS